MRDPASRQAVLDLLPDALRGAIRPGGSMQEQLVNVVRTCQEYAGSWTSLVAALGVLAEGSIALDEFVTIVREVVPEAGV